MHAEFRLCSTFIFANRLIDCCLKHHHLAVAPSVIVIHPPSFVYNRRSLSNACYPTQDHLCYSPITPQPTIASRHDRIFHSLSNYPPPTANGASKRRQTNIVSIERQNLITFSNSSSASGQRAHGNSRRSSSLYIGNRIKNTSLLIGNVLRNRDSTQSYEPGRSVTSQ